ncbi:hypothetical protein TTHERM_000253465 (macronuclear) [Tetrahymena thermophila SB210]|uniref:Uncharacterized protein n=1 Tax=Tetrahymena thermophila (strain SB210) TaxID=312017 RepID=W7XB10_TETTS|nr:hypothetical protein TTHERM_000253465 [Tetrahymena thermophila SB210]EWS73613.1 hypothetical protein TTHERM_000253465 [Tetrahymena thermophila SB210]|eukprot:XP_012653843.1 hypothetical protein TTHERM_000253465 [Tetrahymena thermophila SB210]
MRMYKICQIFGSRHSLNYNRCRFNQMEDLRYITNQIKIHQIKKRYRKKREKNQFVFTAIYKQQIQLSQCEFTVVQSILNTNELINIAN